MSKISSGNYKLVGFDCDGVLIDGHASIYIADKLGFGTKIREVYKDVIIGLRNFSQAVEGSLKLFIGLKERDISSILNSIPLMVGAEETIVKLKRGGLIVGAISSGASQYFVDILKHRLNLDFALGTGVKIEDGIFTGITPPIIGIKNKDRYFEKVAKEYGCNLSECIAVGDDFSNVSLFKKVGFSIAFNTGCLRRELQMLDLSIKDKLILRSKLSLAELRVRHSAHVVIDAKNLTTILPVLLKLK
ncbi:MAG: HAD family phosphatase [archaeon]|nr:HAD family phosphatase [archaeon]MCP8307018.1 HAD family phosphatase [archaeon]